MLKSTDIIELGIPKTLFGVGAIARLSDVVQGFGTDKVLVITDKGLVAAGVVDAPLNVLREAGITADVFDGAGAEAPVSIVLQLADLIKEKGYGLLVALGGGSSMDTTKTAGSLASNPDLTPDDLIKWRPYTRKLPVVAVPTTAGTGSEWSAMAVIHNDVGDGVHYPCMSQSNFPDVVIIDPAMTSMVPPRITADTGIDALSHAIEAFTSPNANVFTDMLAEFAIGMIAKSLRPAYAKGEFNLDDRFNMSIAASTAMLAMSMTGPGLAHLGNETLGAMASLTHGRATGLLLPAVMRFNLMTDPFKFARIAQLLGEDVSGLSATQGGELAVDAVRRLLDDLGMPGRLTDVGVGEERIPELARELAENRAPLVKWAACRELTTEQAADLYRNLL